MAVVFLIGGTGNQLFQYSGAFDGDRFSYFFLSKRFCKLFNWTCHERIFDYPEAARSMQLLALVVMMFDRLLFLISKRTLFTEFDLPEVEATPSISRWFALGYFQQSDRKRRAVDDLTKTLKSQSVASLPIVLHIRGGDFAKNAANGVGIHGLLTEDYYSRALSRVELQSRPGGTIYIHSDDHGYARDICGEFDRKWKCTVVDGGLTQFIQDAIRAEVFISSNSTLSYWVIMLRGASRKSIAPRPFQPIADFDFFDETERVRVSSS